jgi:hypothetical protein
MADIFEKVFETIYIYKSIVICKNNEDVTKVHQALFDKDYAVTVKLDDEDNRMLILDTDTFYQLKDNDLQWEDYDVIFVSNQAREVMSQLGMFNNVKMIVVFNSSFQDS